MISQAPNLAQKTFLSNFVIKTLNIKDEKYPDGLKQISDPPKTLFYRGQLINNDQCFAIVGTRRCSEYGKELAFSISQDLSRSGLTIVSGMATGIDSFVHKGVLEANGKTIAVLGTGLDNSSIYPQENLKLADKILKQDGCLISEYPNGTHGSQFTFPQRNRIISAISLGVLVIEAKTRSGALITANWANKQGKKVFALPGNIHSQNSKGPHLLIKTNKAILIESANDILKELNLSPTPTINKNYRVPISINLEEKLIIKVLTQGSLSIDKIIEKTKLPSHKVSSSLSLMEIENKVKNFGNNIYAIINR